MILTSFPICVDVCRFMRLTLLTSLRGARHMRGCVASELMKGGGKRTPAAICILSAEGLTASCDEALDNLAGAMRSFRLPGAGDLMALFSLISLIHPCSFDLVKTSFLFFFLMFLPPR